MLKVLLQVFEPSKRVRSVRALPLGSPFGGEVDSKPVDGSRVDQESGIWEIPCGEGWHRLCATLVSARGEVGTRFFECWAPRTHEGPPLDWPLRFGGPLEVQIQKNGEVGTPMGGVEVRVSEMDPMQFQGPTTAVYGAARGKSCRPGGADFYWYGIGRTTGEGTVRFEDLPYGQLLVTLADELGNRRTELVAHEPNAGTKSLWFDSLIVTPPQIRVDGEAGKRACALWYSGGKASRSWPLECGMRRVYRSAPPNQSGLISLSGADARSLSGVVVSPGCEPAFFQLPAVDPAFPGKKRLAKVSLRESKLVQVDSGHKAFLSVYPSFAGKVAVKPNGVTTMQCSHKFNPEYWVESKSGIWEPLNHPMGPEATDWSNVGEGKEVVIELPLRARDHIASTVLRLSSSQGDSFNKTIAVRHKPIQISWDITKSSCRMQLHGLAGGRSFKVYSSPLLWVQLFGEPLFLRPSSPKTSTIQSDYPLAKVHSFVLQDRDGQPVVGAALASMRRLIGISSPTGEVGGKLKLPCELSLGHIRLPFQSLWISDMDALNLAFKALPSHYSRVLVLPSGELPSDRGASAMVLLARTSSGDDEALSVWDGCQAQYFSVPASGGRVRMYAYRLGDSRSDAQFLGTLRASEDGYSPFKISPVAMKGF